MENVIKPERAPRVVVDTNVIVSAIHFDGKPEEILFLANAKRIRLVLSEYILQEVENVLREKLHWSPSKAQEAVDMLSEIAEVVMTHTHVSILGKNEGDNKILACTKDGEVKYLITGDKKHLLPLKRFAGARIVSPDEFLKIWNS